MKYDLLKPCALCPFRKKTPMRLHRSRALEIGRMMLDAQGGTFPCHETIDYDEDEELHIQHAGQHCAGALLFAEKNGNATQMMRIAERLRMYDHTKLAKNHHLVFDSLKQMVAHLTKEPSRRSPESGSRAP